MQAHIVRHPAPLYDPDVEGQAFYGSRSTWGKRTFDNAVMLCIRYSQPELHQRGAAYVEAWRMQATEMGLLDYYPLTDDEPDVLLEYVYAAFSDIEL